MEFPEPATVYALYSTRDGRIRYVGQTTGLPEWRHSGHKQAAKAGKGGALNEWMRGEVAVGFDIGLHVLDAAGTLNETEREHINILRAAGYDLLNKRDGGGAVAGDRRCKPMAPEHRAKIAASAKGRAHSVAARAKMATSARASTIRRRAAAGHPTSLLDNAGIGVVTKHLTGQRS